MDYNYQLATDKAITGNRDNDTPVQSQAERKYPLGKSVPTNEGSSGRTPEGCKSRGAG